MKTKHLLLLVLIAVFSSCSSAYRTGQTPDDVYYSPAPPPPVDYVTTDNQQDRDTYAYNNTYNSEDLEIRRGIRDPRYRSNISLDFGYGYSPYDYYGSSFYSPYSSYYNPYAFPGVTFYPYNHNYYSHYSPFNNYYYSPFNNYYYPPVYYSKYSSPVSNYTGPRTYNLGVYNNNTNSNRGFNHPVQPTTINSAPVRTFPTRPANRSGVGSFIRRVLTPSNNNTRSYSNDNNSNDHSSPARTIQTNTSGSSSSSSSSGSSSAPVRTFRK
jgi:hypothetical protein